MDVLLILPPGGYYAERWQRGSLQPPLGVLYLGAVLEENGFQVGIIDAHVERLTYAGLAGRVSEVGPKIVGISFCTDNRFEAFQTISEIRKALPKVPLVVGGPHPSLAAQDTLENISGIDYVVQGEGEVSFLKLVRAILGNKEEVSGIAGVSYRKNGNIVHNPGHEFILDLDKVPFPARHLIPWKKYNFTMEVPGRGALRGGTIMASRGCPFTCNFCSSAEMWGRKVRFRTPANIVQEIQLMKEKLGVQALWYLDDVFAIKKQHAMDLCKAMVEAKLDIPWICEIRVDIVDFELLETLKNTGCYCVGFGVESGSQRVLDRVVHKKIKVEKVRQVRDWCQKLGLISNPFFIYSHPDETEEDLRMTLDLIKSFPKESWIGMKLLHIYPGTEVERIAYEKGMLPRDFSWAKPMDKRVEVLPSTQGDVPIFRDKLSWEQLGRAMFEWASIRKYPVWKKIPTVLKDIRSPRDIARYISLAWSFLGFKLGWGAKA
ncbi:MAG: radical SAM protein [Acidobacteriota bacterium]